MQPKEGATVKADVVLVGLEQEENIGLRSIASFLESNGINVQIEPYGHFSKNRLLEKILFLQPKILGFSVLFQGMLPNYHETVRYLRANDVNAHFTIGGHFPTIEPQKVLELMPEIDTVVRHEGELTLLELYNHLASPQQWREIKGLVYRKDGGYEFTPTRPLIENLDALPFPKRNEEIDTFRGLGASSILASRGCLFNCSYCSIREFYNGAPGPRRRTRSPSNVTQEIELLYRRGVRFFKFVDDDLGMKTPAQQTWMKQFALELQNRGLASDILWRIAVRVDELDLDMLKLLKNVGLGFVFLGIEAGCEQSLKVFNKGYSVEKIHQGIEALRKADVKLEYGFMMFDPESTFSSIRENLAFLAKLCCDGQATVHFTKVYPLVGTALAKRLEREGRLVQYPDYPSYNYTEKRLELFEAFVFKTFQNAFFGVSGLSGRLSMLRFDCEVLKRFHPSKFNIEEYDKQITHLTQEYDASALKTLNTALDYLEGRDLARLEGNCSFLDQLTKLELAAQSKIEISVNSLYPSLRN